MHPLFHRVLVVCNPRTAQPKCPIKHQHQHQHQHHQYHQHQHHTRNPQHRHRHRSSVHCSRISGTTRTKALILSFITTSIHSFIHSFIQPLIHYWLMILHTSLFFHITGSSRKLRLKTLKLEWIWWIMTEWPSKEELGWMASIYSCVSYFLTTFKLFSPSIISIHEISSGEPQRETCNYCWKLWHSTNFPWRISKCTSDEDVCPIHFFFPSRSLCNNSTCN